MEWMNEWVKILSWHIKLNLKLKTKTQSVQYNEMTHHMKFIESTFHINYG